MLKGNYDEKCDIWSCGVILYIFLSGVPPFQGKTNEEVIQKVVKGNFTFARINPQKFIYLIAQGFKRVSQDAISFIKKMMSYNPKRRITSEEALRDVWMIKFTQKDNVSVDGVLSAVKNLQAFQAKSSMHKAVLTYMTSHIINKKDEQNLRNIFEMLDTNHDGQLSQEELLEGFKLLYSEDLNKAKAEVAKAMKRLDLNKNGTIDYNGKPSLSFNKNIEFLTANIKVSDYLKTEELKMAFDYFDEVILGDYNYIGS